MSKPKHKVVWSVSAETDLSEIIEFIAQRNPENVARVLDAIEKEARKLEAFPERGRLVPELMTQQIIDYRERIVNPWRVIYSVKRNHILVAAVIDGRRDFSDHLFKRILRAR